jgi:phage shock protein A
MHLEANARNSLFRRSSPEELELACRRREVADLRAALADREKDLAHLRDQIFSFEGRYIRQVGVLYIQLEQWQTRIAKLQVASESMEDTERLLNEALKDTPEEIVFEAEASKPTPNVRALFRELAKRIHPDFARDVDDERHRTQLMAQANAALLRNDPDLLHRMLHGHDLPHDHNATPAAELARSLKLLQHLRADLTALEAEIQILTLSEMAQLRARTLLAAAKGQDYLAELAARVKGNIGNAMRRYELDLGRIRRKEAAFNPTSLLTAELSDTKADITAKIRAKIATRVRQS